MLGRIKEIISGTHKGTGIDAGSPLPPAEIGEVKWNFRGGYVSGLEEIEPLFDQGTRAGCQRYFFARDVAVYLSNPGAEQSDVVECGERLVEEGVLSREQLDYMYKQFGFDPENYEPPDWVSRLKK